MKNNRLFRSLGMTLLSAALFAPVCFAEDFYCEVMSVEGTVTVTNSSVSAKALAEGDLLAVDDVVAVGPSSYVDIAYDRDWNNVTRVEENSSIRVRSLYPTEVELTGGGVFAKLKSLPKESSFDVSTPTAIASVRGTEYRTTYLEGETQVYNISDSDVYVYGKDSAGQAGAEPVIVRNTEKTVARRGEGPNAPRPMETHEIQRVGEFQRHVEKHVMDNIGRGRVGKLPDVGAIERRIEERRQQGGPGGMNKRMEVQRDRIQQQGQGQGREGKVGEGRPGQPQTMSGEEARQKVEQGKAGPAAGNDQGGGFRSGQGMQERRPGGQAGGRTENQFEGRGLGQPFFPGDERHRSGGPEPQGFPDQRWKTPGEQDGRQERQPEPRQRMEGSGQNPGAGPDQRKGGQQGGGQNKPQQGRQGGGKPAGRPQR